MIIMWDLRTPSGYFFAILGVILILVGVFAGYRAPLTDVNVNLYTGISALVFGGFLLWMAHRAS